MHPDIAVEIDITKDSLSEFHIYAALKIPEIWRYDGKNVQRISHRPLSLKSHPSTFLLVVDDDDARKYAIEQNIPIIGTAGILVLAKQNGFITEVRQLLEQLLARGFYMSRATSRRCFEPPGKTNQRSQP